MLCAASLPKTVLKKKKSHLLLLVKLDIAGEAIACRSVHVDKTKTGIKTECRDS